MKEFIKDLNLSGVSKATYIRGIMLALVLINFILNKFGINPIKADENSIGNIVEIVITVYVALTSYWENNSFTKTAQIADEKYNELKNE